ncbi:MAG: glycosyltransferase [Methylophilaceae bacterium]
MTRSVVYVIGSLGKGGAESQLLMLMRGLPKGEFAPYLFVLEAVGPLRSTLESTLIPIVDGGYDSRAAKPLKVLQLLRASWRLWKLLRYNKVSVVHGFLPLTNLIAAVVGRFANTSLIVTSRRALNKHQDRMPGWRYLDLLSSHLSHVITANAEAVRDDTLRREGGNPAKMHVIYNGLDVKPLHKPITHRVEMRRVLGLNDSQVVVIIVANLIPYKGHSELINAMAQLLPRFPDIRLLVVGQDRGVGATLKRQADSCGLALAIQWLGLREDIPDLLAAADIYVSASHEEGFSNSLLEAMGAGKPVVATNVGGTPEMLAQGKLGLLVEPADADGLTKALAVLIDNPEMRLQFGQMAADQVAAQYSVDEMVKQYLMLYRGGLDK